MAAVQGHGTDGPAQAHSELHCTPVTGGAEERIGSYGAAAAKLNKSKTAVMTGIKKALRDGESVYMGYRWRLP